MSGSADRWRGRASLPRPVRHARRAGARRGGGRRRRGRGRSRQGRRRWCPSRQRRRPASARAARSGSRRRIRSPGPTSGRAGRRPAAEPALPAATAPAAAARPRSSRRRARARAVPDRGPPSCSSARRPRSAPPGETTTPARWPGIEPSVADEEAFTGCGQAEAEPVAARPALVVAHRLELPHLIHRRLGEHRRVGAREERSPAARGRLRCSTAHRAQRRARSSRSSASRRRTSSYGSTKYPFADGSASLPGRPAQSERSLAAVRRHSARTAARRHAPRSRVGARRRAAFRDCDSRPRSRGCTR